MQKKMKNNEWNIPSDYFEKNKKALMPVRKFPTGKWLLALAAACFVGIGLFMWKGEGQTQEVAQGKRREEKVREGKIENEKQNENETLVKRGEEKVREGKIKENMRGEEKVREGKIKENMRGEEKVREGKIKENMRGEEKVREGKSKEEVALGLKEIPREELVAYLLEEDTDLIENIN
jgi:uncharacterized protein HemX